MNPVVNVESVNISNVYNKPHFRILCISFHVLIVTFFELWQRRRYYFVFFLNRRFRLFLSKIEYWPLCATYVLNISPPELIFLCLIITVAVICQFGCET